MQLEVANGDQDGINLSTSISFQYLFLPGSAHPALSGTVNQAFSITVVGTISGLASQSSQCHLIQRILVKVRKYSMWVF